MIFTKQTYEQIRPLILWLGILQLAWISYWLLAITPPSPIFQNLAFLWITVLVVWAIIAISLGKRGFFLKYSFLFSNMIGLAFILAFSISLFTLLPEGWNGLVIAAKNIPDIQLVAIHTLRLLAIGTIIKYLHKELPLHFLIMGSLPDFLFAVSAVVVAYWTAHGVASDQFLIIWHLVGAAVFLGAGFSMFFSVPSLLHFLPSKPDTALVFQYPMNFAPNFTVPLFMLAHGIALVKLLLT